MKKINRFPGTGFNHHCIAAAILALAIMLAGTPGFAGVSDEAAKAKTASDGAVKASLDAVPASTEAMSVSTGMVTASTEANSVSTEVPDNSGDLSRWSLETSLTFHIVNIYMLKATYRYSDRVELSIGPAFQNWKNEDQSFIGQAHAYTLVLSYRNYFWRNFNVELELWPAWNNFKSFIDDNTYRGLELWVEYKLGYRVDLGRRFNINVQPGIGHPVWMQNKWPGVEYDNHLRFILDELIFVPQVLLGFRF